MESSFLTVCVFYFYEIISYSHILIGEIIKRKCYKTDNYCIIIWILNINKKNGLHRDEKRISILLDFKNSAYFLKNRKPK